MGKYDKNVPELLKETQTWFAGIITTPMEENSQISKISPSGEPISIEAGKYIIPSPTLQPEQRIQIYNQQYWWRLLSTLHDNFPLTTRLFGYYDFNRLVGIPYLQDCPPNHWSLNLLGETLHDWAQKSYHQTDRTLILEAIEADFAYIKAFFAAQLPLELSSENEILNEKLYLQPHLTLHQFTHKLLPFRQALIKHEPEYWDEETPPPLEDDKDFFFITYRNANNHVVWAEIDKNQYCLLREFTEGKSIGEISDWLEKQDEELQVVAARNLHLWFQEWTVYKWLGKN